MGRADLKQPIAVSSERIEGVQVKQLKPIADGRGRLMEILRSDDPLFQQFGQLYMTSAYPGVVKGWHYHKIQVDHFSCVRGMIKLVLYDDRKDSGTRGLVNEYFLGVHGTVLVTVPTFVLHGFQSVGTEEAIVLNVPTVPYNYSQPDEYRIDPHDNDIPYDWHRIDR